MAAYSGHRGVAMLQLLLVHGVAAVVLAVVVLALGQAARGRGGTARPGHGGGRDRRGRRVAGGIRDRLPAAEQLPGADGVRVRAAAGGLGDRHRHLGCGMSRVAMMGAAAAQAAGADERAVAPAAAAADRHRVGPGGHRGADRAPVPLPAGADRAVAGPGRDRRRSVVAAGHGDVRAVRQGVADRGRARMHRRRRGPGRAVYGHGPWLLLYLGCGVLGQAFGYLWEPLPDAGASVAGAEAARGGVRLAAVPGRAAPGPRPRLGRSGRRWGSCSPRRATCGPPLLAGFGAGALLVWRDRRRVALGTR